MRHVPFKSLNTGSTEVAAPASLSEDPYVCVCAHVQRCWADLLGIVCTQSLEGVLQALALLAVGGDHPHPGHLHPLPPCSVRVRQHAPQLEEEGCC